MQINNDGVEIDDAQNMEAYGEWVKFTDGEGATVKISLPTVIALYRFIQQNGAWRIEDWEE
jgi:2-C-methyl-D-erythritol 4-phosphate cytidylyltransferase